MTRAAMGWIVAVAISAVGCGDVDRALLGTEDVPSALQERALRAAREAYESGDAPNWQHASLSGEAYPLYRPDLEGVAYYEVRVVAPVGGEEQPRRAGYILLSTGRHDMPVVQWSHEGDSPVERLEKRARDLERVAERYYLLDPLSFAVEDPAGELIATDGGLPPRISGMDLSWLENREEPRPDAALQRSEWQSWAALKRGYAASYAVRLEALRQDAAEAWAAIAPEEASQPGIRRQALSSSWSSWKTYSAGSNVDQRWYHQMFENSAPNTSGCASGCGATAWAMLFGWGDYRASLGDSTWKYSWGLYRKAGGRGADAVAPSYMDAGVKNMTWEIRNHIGTWCNGSQGATWPHTMERAKRYLKDRTAATISVMYNSAALPSASKRDAAKSIIINQKTPVIIALGWNHYALAYKYRTRSRKTWYGTERQHQFYINEGHGGGRRWTGAGIWFVGQLKPAPRVCSKYQTVCRWVLDCPTGEAICAKNPASSACDTAMENCVLQGKKKQVCTKKCVAW